MVFETVFSFFEDFTKLGFTPEIQLSEIPVYVSGDETGLKRVIQNIIENTLEHGCRDFSVTLTEENQYAHLQFTNSAVNLKQINTDKIFDHFYKADPARQKSSTGLGLAISKELVERMNGAIVAEVDGTIFSITISIPKDLNNTSKLKLV